MDRYAEGLLGGLREVTEDLTIVEAIPPDPWPIPRGMLLTRMLLYPRWARRHQKNKNHVLDHSYGHLLSGLDPSRTVISTHDIAPLLFPGARLGLSGLAWRAAMRGTVRAAQIITISDSTKRGLIDYFGIDPDKLTTVHLGVEPMFCLLSSRILSAAKEKFALPDRFLLHVGNTSPRKNFETLVEALSLLEIDLIQVGTKPSEEQLRLIEKLGLSERVHFLGHLSDDALVSVYNLASVLVFPSTYEGFGFPVLESMACGTPVVASDASSLPEVVGDAGILVSPRDSFGFAQAVQNLLSDAGLAETLREKGFARAKRMTWLHTAERTLDVYRRLG